MKGRRNGFVQCKLRIKSTFILRGRISSRRNCALSCLSISSKSIFTKSEQNLGTTIDPEANRFKIELMDYIDYTLEWNIQLSLISSY